MKKVFIYFCIIIGLCISVFAFYGGETQAIYKIYDCYGRVNIAVTPANPANQSEYSFFNCTESPINSWRCGCGSYFNLKMSTNENTVNNYSIEIDYLYEKKSEKSGGILTQTNSYIIESSKDLPKDNIYMPFELKKDTVTNVTNETIGLSSENYLRNKETINVIVEDSRPIKQMQNNILLLILVGGFAFLLVIIIGVFMIFR